MDTLIYLVKLFSCLVGGMLVVLIFRSWFSNKLAKLTNVTLTVCLYALLFSMGVRTGLIEDIEMKLSMMGRVALTFAILTTTGSALVVIGARAMIIRIQRKRRSRRRGILP